jgi:hypothetical protein
VLFKWDGVVEGDIDDVFTFCNQVRGEEYDNTAVGPSPILSTCDTLTVIDPKDCVYHKTRIIFNNSFTIR